jgi:hypothetical protein
MSKFRAPQEFSEECSVERFMEKPTESPDSMPLVEVPPESQGPVLWRLSQLALATSADSPSPPVVRSTSDPTPSGQQNSPKNFELNVNSSESQAESMWSEPPFESRIVRQSEFGLSALSVNSQGTNDDYLVASSVMEDEAGIKVRSFGFSALSFPSQEAGFEVLGEEIIHPRRANENTAIKTAHVDSFLNAFPASSSAETPPRRGNTTGKLEIKEEETATVINNGKMLVNARKTPGGAVFGNEDAYVKNASADLQVGNLVETKAPSRPIGLARPRRRLKDYSHRKAWLIRLSEPPPLVGTDINLKNTVEAIQTVAIDLAVASPVPSQPTGFETSQSCESGAPTAVIVGKGSTGTVCDTDMVTVDGSSHCAFFVSEPGESNKEQATVTRALDTESEPKAVSTAIATVAAPTAFVTATAPPAPSVEPLSSTPSLSPTICLPGKPALSGSSDRGSAAPTECANGSKLGVANAAGGNRHAQSTKAHVVDKYSQDTVQHVDNLPTVRNLGTALDAVSAAEADTEESSCTQVWSIATGVVDNIPAKTAENAEDSFEDRAAEVNQESCFGDKGRLGKSFAQEASVDPSGATHSASSGFPLSTQSLSPSPVRPTSLTHASSLLVPRIRRPLPLPAALLDSCAADISEVDPQKSSEGNDVQVTPTLMRELVLSRLNTIKIRTPHFFYLHSNGFCALSTFMSQVVWLLFLCYANLFDLMNLLNVL